ncbi:hypothetical protein [Gemmobacter caeruleus]|uniref:hypothetical protein n=1 Tax=Gemmobacter caeruleus TaxID=2595004 RepID=UPI0011ECFEFE|nr:hypothetical protein [Gemmobacter caeruleus]
MTRKTFRAVLLTLILVIGSFGMAVARAQPVAVSTLVICSGYGVTTVALDAEGNPVPMVHLCPDCVMAGVAILPDLVLPARPEARAERLSRPVPALPAGHAPPQPRARGPPILI